MRSKGERLTRSAASSDGFTVIEFVAAAAILFIVLMGILGAVEYAGAATRMASVRQGAINVAQEQIEADRTRTWDKIGVTYADGSKGNPAGDILATQTVSTARAVYTVSTNVSWNTDPDSTHTVSTKEISVRVAWSSPTAGSVSLETAVYGTGATGNLGNVQLIAVDDDHRTDRLKDIVFRLTPNGGGVQQVITDVDGVAVWGGVKTGNWTALTGSSLVSGAWLVPSPPPGVPISVAAGWNDWGFVYCVKPCTASFHVKSSSGASLASATVVLKNSDPAHPSTVSGTTDADGNVDFGMLWKTYAGSYSATATWNSAVSPATTFTLATGGLAYPSAGTRAELVVPDPPSIRVSLAASTTMEPLSGNTWTVTLKNPSGASLGTVTTSADSYTFPISVAGNYKAIVKNVTNSGVVAFFDNPGFTFAANATDPNQNCVVPVGPLYRVCVRQGGPLMPSGYATISAPATMTITNAVSGAWTSYATTSGVASFVIPADGNYNRTVVVNRITYPLSGILQSTLDAAHPPVLPDYIDLNAGGFIITVSPITGNRKVGLYDQNKVLVAWSTATVAAPTVTFLVPGGVYTAAVCKSGVSPPATLPSGTQYKYLSLTVPTNGTTVSGTSPPPN